jgi:hypothetical protein
LSNVYRGLYFKNLSIKINFCKFPDFHIYSHPPILDTTATIHVFIILFFKFSFQDYNAIREIIYSKGKVKAIPLQAWTGPEGSRRLKLPDF